MPNPTHKPLYIMRTDAVLIHPALPGFPILNPPRMAAKPDSRHAQFVVGLAIKPISWPGILSWYGIKQPNRARIWPLRALLHLYLMVSLRHKISEYPGPSVDFINAHPEATYQSLLDSGAHYMGNFWPRFTEMLLLALKGVKEQNIHPMISTLLDSAANEDYRSEVLDKFSEALQQVRAHVQTGSHVDVGLTRRRAGIIERALHDCLVRGGRMQRAMPALSTDSPLIAAHKTLIQTTQMPSLFDISTPVDEVRRG